MHLTRLGDALILGIAIAQMCSGITSSPVSDCLASVKTCMSSLCKSQEAFYGGICDDDGCQIDGSEVCNSTIPALLDQFPPLCGCVCAWEGELCDSIQALATQCQRRPAAQEKRSTVMDWQSSRLIGHVYDAAGSCMDRMTVCVGDAVCNRYLAPVLQACMGELCDSQRCREVSQQFYGNMPLDVAEMLVMCECEASDQSCVQMTSALQSGTCEDETVFCLQSLDLCIEDSHCRKQLKTLRTKCWSAEDAQCSDSDLQANECFTRMDPDHILGGNSECKTAFFATLGTALHRPCTCIGLHNEDLLACNMIRDVLHNRAWFRTSRKTSLGPPTSSPTNDSEQGHMWLQEYLLYGVATVLFVGVVLLMTMAVVSILWMLRRKEKTKYHHPQKSHCGAIL